MPNFRKEGSRYLTVTKVKTYHHSAVPVSEAHPLRLERNQTDEIRNFLMEYPIDEQQVLKHYEHVDDSCMYLFQCTHAFIF